MKAETGYESTELWIIDLARISSVVDFAERFEKDRGRIDILLLNAGITPSAGQQLTADGYEPTSVLRYCKYDANNANSVLHRQVPGQQLVHFPSRSSSTTNNTSNLRKAPHKSKDSRRFERRSLLG